MPGRVRPAQAEQQAPRETCPRFCRDQATHGRPATSRAVHPFRDSVGLRHGERKALHMTGDTATRASSAHVYPLTIRELLLTGVRRAPTTPKAVTDNVIASMALV